MNSTSPTDIRDFQNKFERIIVYPSIQSLNIMQGDGNLKKEKLNHLF